MRLEMARFLQETVEEVSVSGTSGAAAAKEFTEFFNKVAFISPCVLGRSLSDQAPTL